MKSNRSADPRPTRTPATRSFLLALVSVILLTAGCGPGERGGGAAGQRVDGFPPCPTRSPLAPSNTSDLPRLSLTCMDGSGEKFTLSTPLGKPMVINLWGSWCPPCGRELPAFVRLDQAGDDVVVLGVVTEDSPSRARAAAGDLGVKFPNLWDREGKLRRKLGRNALPVTLFVDADGQIRHVHGGPVFDDASLRDATRRYLGVGVRTAR